jgi:cation transport ATPase
MSRKFWSSLVLMSALVAVIPACAAEPNQTMNNAQKQALHRADFRVEGASCVMCLRRIAATFRKDKGVKKADVSVFRPYWSIVIYDANQTNMQKLTGAIKSEHVKLAELEDKPIDSMPAIIIPKGLGAPSSEKEKAKTK